MPSAIDWTRVHPSNNPQFAHFASRRSTVVGAKGMVASSQPLASQAGLEILNKGGNAGEWRWVFCTIALLLNPSSSRVQRTRLSQRVSDLGYLRTRTVLA